MTAASAPRIGLLFPGEPGDPATWSGTPAGLAAGLAHAEMSVVPLRAEAPPPFALAATGAVSLLRLHRTLRPPLGAAKALTRAVARASPELGTVHTWSARASLRRGRPLDGVVQIGAGYEPRPRGLPLVTYEDITIPLALELGYPEWRTLSRRAVVARMDRQRRVYEHADACCMSTSWAAQSVVRDYGIPAAKVHAVGVGRNHTSEPVERDWSIPRFLFVGSAWEGKNGPALLRAFARLRAELPAATLDLVGPHPTVAEPGVTGHGVLRRGDPAQGRRLEDLLAHATCLVVPSRYEAAGIVYVEAAAAGIPSIGTAAGGSADLIGDGGRVVDPGDEDALLAAMLELADPEVAARLGSAARSRAALFTWEAVAGRVLRALSPAGVRVESLPAFL
jgi:glycosyltransferase involved in cell wall biosynthesis